MSHMTRFFRSIFLVKSRRVIHLRIVLQEGKQTPETPETTLHHHSRDLVKHLLPENLPEPDCLSSSFSDRPVLTRALGSSWEDPSCLRRWQTPAPLGWFYTDTACNPETWSPTAALQMTCRGRNRSTTERPPSHVSHVEPSRSLDWGYQNQYYIFQHSTSWRSNHSWAEFKAALWLNECVLHVVLLQPSPVIRKQ